MATKSFLYLALTVFLLQGCQTTKTRPNVEQAGQPIPTPPADKSIPQTLPQPVTPQPGAAIKVGVFLGPGALRSFAHVGVLRALQKAQIPIAAIGGMEWGSVVAASYTLSRGLNEVEWEMLKLRKDQLPSPSLISHDVKPKDSQDLFNFLNAAFGSKDLASGSVPFRCATTDGDRVDFISNGKAREQLLKCAALPPLYSFYDRAGKEYISGALSPGDWSGEFRKLGIQFIIYVDVLSRGRFLSSQADPQLKALWYAVKATSKQQHLFANVSIEIPTDLELTDYDHRRDVIVMGEQGTLPYIPMLKQNLGL